ncbi:superoxide dismutase family protein [Dongia deserti]|uniref:superoxide dismutase family protein n=1 Tax=Dongia deserti TaxID=2268030 RepID=UPI000E64CCD5|nr:superoxide dismutase family protein [Dongia deserti]
MTRTKLAALSLGFLCASSAAVAQTPQQQAVATFFNPQGQEIGKAILTQTTSGVLIDIDVSRIPNGEHGFHIHETGICDSADGFKSAGGHFDPAQQQHGYMAEHGSHAGDMPNQFVGADGKLRAQVLNPNVTLTTGPTNVLDADGSALIIHADPDDYSTQPAGNAGDRIVCAVVKK